MGEFMTEDWSHWGELGVTGSTRIRQISSEECHIFIERERVSLEFSQTEHSEKMIVIFLIFKQCL